MDRWANAAKEKGNREPPMPYLRLRRALELAALDRPWVQRWFLRKDGDFQPEPAAKWDDLYEKGAYDRLLDSSQMHHHRLLASLVAERTPDPRVLEIGCGEGAFYQVLRLLRRTRYLGTDISPVAIERARARFGDELEAGRVEFVAVDGVTFTTEERFDVIVMADCIEYLGTIDEILARYAPLLAPGGIIAVSQWMSPRALRLWRQIKTKTTVLDEAVVSAPWGGAWQVWTCRPLQA